MGSTEEASAEARPLPRDRLSELYERHADDATRLAYLLTGDRELARDLAQDAFVKVAGRFGSLRGEDGFARYLRSTIFNLVRSHFRHLKVERRHLLRQSAQSAALSPPGVELRHDLMERLMQLPVRQRAAVVFRYYGDLSEQATADAMQCSVAAVRSLTFRALASLRVSIDKEVAT